MSSLLKNLLIALVVIAAGGGAYYFLVARDSNSVVSTTSAVDLNSQAELQTREFKNILTDLNRIDLDSELFQDQNFLSLKDFSQPIVDRPFGRVNPFIAE